MIVRPKKTIRFLLVSAVAMLMACSHTQPWPDESLRTMESESRAIAREYPQAGAVILEDIGEMEITHSGETAFSRFLRRRAVRILGPRGLDQANVVIPYAPPNQITSIRARTITPSGTVISLNSEDIFDITLYPDFIFFSDQRAKIFTLPGVEPGSVIEYEYTHQIQGQTLWHGWSFQHSHPVRLSLFSLSCPSQWEIQWKSYQIEAEPKIEKGPQGFPTQYVWEARNIPALKREFAMPSVNETSAWLSLSPWWIDHWDDVASWVHGLWKAPMKAGSPVKALADSLTRNIPSPREKMAVLFNWVRDHIRYVSVKIGAGGFQPHPVDDVLIHRYGDCKDMTALLCALGRHAGLDLRPVLVSTRQNGAIDTTQATYLAFNHAMACGLLGTDTLFMDPTDKGTPFERLPWYDQDMPVLSFTDEGKSEWMRTPRQSLHLQTTRLNATLNSAGFLNIRGVTRYRGQPASFLRQQHQALSPDEIVQWAQSQLTPLFPGARLDTVTVCDPQPMTDSIRVTFTGSHASFLKTDGTPIWLLPAQFLNFSLPDLFLETRRSHPVHFRFPVNQTVQLHLTLPPNYQMTEKNFQRDISASLGSLSIKAEQNGRMFNLFLTLHLTGEPVPPEKYPVFKQDLEKMRQVLNHPIPIKKRGRHPLIEK